jgi:hypothetical protein
MDRFSLRRKTESKLPYAHGGGGGGRDGKLNQTKVHERGFLSNLLLIWLLVIRYYVLPRASMPGRIFSLSKTMRGVSMRSVFREVSTRKGGATVKSQVSSVWLQVYIKLVLPFWIRRDGHHYAGSRSYAVIWMLIRIRPFLIDENSRKPVKNSVADPDPRSGACLTPGSGIQDRGGVKKYGSGMNNQDHISQSLETIFWVKVL